MSNPLQFDRMEPGSPAQAIACAACKNVLAGEYFVAQDVKFCADCRRAIEAQLGKPPAGMQITLAAAAGIAAVVAVDGVYISLLPNMGQSIVALFSGMIVGFAVRKGSGNRGGRIFQVLAVVLTYLMVSGAFLPAFLRAGEFDVKHLGLWLISPVASGSLWTTVLTGFGLYEAWRINQAPRLVFHGPFPVGGKAANG